MNNILFKFAVDHENIFGEQGDAYAAKIAGRKKTKQNKTKTKKQKKTKTKQKKQN